MSTTVTNDIHLQKEEIIKKIRSLDPSFEIIERETGAGINIEVQSIDENIPIINLIMNILNNDLTLRLEIIGNIIQYVVDEIVSYILKIFNLVYLEVTDPKTGLVKFFIHQQDATKNTLYSIYKKEIFNFHYAREDGRLLAFFDQGNLWYIPKPLKMVTSSKRPFTKPSLSTSRQILAKSEVKVERKEILEPKPEKIEEPKVETKKDPITATKPKILPELTQKEQIVLKLVESRPNKKVQSKGLRKELASMDQDTIRDTLRSLVAKGLLYVRSAWYIVKEDPAEDTWDIASDTPIEERLRSLSSKERKIYEILANRPGNKAQARMLVKETKMTKDNLKKILRNMVAKDILYVYAAWYVIKE